MSNHDDGGDVISGLIGIGLLAVGVVGACKLIGAVARIAAEIAVAIDEIPAPGVVTVVARPPEPAPPPPVETVRQNVQPENARREVAQTSSNDNLCPSCHQTFSGCRICGGCLHCIGDRNDGICYVCGS